MGGKDKVSVANAWPVTIRFITSLDNTGNMISLTLQVSHKRLAMLAPKCLLSGQKTTILADGCLLVTLIQVNA
jgi:hypothetical protein